MARAVLALGANLGDAGAQIAQAIGIIAGHERVAVLKASTVIESEPWGKTDQPGFHNAAILIETSLEPLELLEFCLRTEAELGRVRVEHWGPRVIDIDVIAYDEIEMESERLTMPHRHAHERDFVMGPLREIAPDIAVWIMNRSGRKSG